MQIDYHMTRELVRDIGLASWKRIKYVRVFKRRGVIILSSVFFFLFVIPDRDMLVFDWKIQIFFYLVISVLFAIFIYYSLRASVIRMNDKATKNISSLFFGPRTIILESDRLVTRDPVRERMYQWCIVSQIGEDKNYLFIDIVGQNLAVVPKSSFLGTHELESFVIEFTKLVEEHEWKGAEAERIENDNQAPIRILRKKTEWIFIDAVLAVLLGPIFGLFLGILALVYIYRVRGLIAQTNCQHCSKRIKIAGIMSGLAVVIWLVVWVVLLV